MVRKIISIIVLLAVLLLIMPTWSLPISAAGVTAAFDSGTLTVSGNGELTSDIVKTACGGNINKSQITSVVFDESSNITSIGQKAFLDCTALTSITIPDSVTSIGQQAFRNCAALTSITIPDSVTSIDTFYLFFGCSSLTSVKIPDGVTSIDGYTFNNCSSLMSVTIPDSVTSIGTQTFNNCSSLMSVTIPEKVTSIGKSAFYGCSSLTEIIIPGSVTEIGETAFSNCKNLGAVTFSEQSQLKSIGVRAFSSCSALTSIVIPDGVTSIGNRIFLGCTSLKSAEIPEGVTYLDDGTFSGCFVLESITIPESVTKIGNNAFLSCKALASITIPKNVTIIDYDAFYNCISLKTIIIPESVTEIGSNVFYKCESLETIMYPTNNNLSVDSAGIPSSTAQIGYATDGDSINITKIIPPAGDDQVSIQDEMAGKTVAFVVSDYREKVIPHGPANEHTENPDENDENKLCLICGQGTAETLPPHKHDNITFIPWTSDDSLPTEAGNWCLMKDVEIDLFKNSSYDYWYAPAGEYNLCLNKHTITVNHTMKIGSGSNVNIYDCQDECGGIVIERNTYAALFDVLSGELTVYNGKLESKYGTVINQSNSDSVTTIEGGTVSGSSCGIMVNSGTVTVNDGTVEGTGDYSDGIECCGPDAELIVNGGSISGSGSDGSGLYVTDGTAAVNGGIVSGDATGIWILGGTVKVENGTIISGNDAGIWCNIDPDDPALVNALEVTGGTINSPSYAIYSGDPDITVKLSGSPALNGDAADIYLGKDAKVSIAAALMNTDPYTVEMYQAGVFTDSDTTGNNNPDKFEAAEIHSDKGYAVVKNSDGQLALTLKPYTVTYDGGEYGEGTIDAVTGIYGTSITLSSDKFTRTGYIQIGWATEDSGEKVYDFGYTYDCYEDITLYPAWAECNHSSASPSWNDNKNDETHSRICEVCGAAITENHSFGDWTDAEDSKNHARICADCGATITEEHTFGDWADAEDNENHTRICKVCGATITENHNFGNWTDTEDSKNHTRICADCGATETEEHTFGDWADAEDSENHTRTCADCGATETEEHTFGNWADCEDGEKHIRTCGVCKAEETAPHTEDGGEITKEATDTEDGKITYKCKDCGYVMRTETVPKTGGNTPEPSKPEPSEPEPEPTEPEPSEPMPAEPVPDDPNAGNVYVDSNSGENAPDVNIDADSAKQLKEEAIAYHLTDEENAAVAGGADLDIILSVEDAGDTVFAEDKQAVVTVLADTSYILGQYLNIDLLKLINGEQVGKITELNTPISVTIEVPEMLRGENRAYAIVRVHEGVAEILEDQDSSPNTITILTDRFSTYAIVYKDKDADDKNQATGVVLQITPFIAAATGVIAFKKRKA